jgi:hypothetical protein
MITATTAPQIDNNTSLSPYVPGDLKFVLMLTNKTLLLTLMKY